MESVAYYTSAELKIKRPKENAVVKKDVEEKKDDDYIFAIGQELCANVVPGETTYSTPKVSKYEGIQMASILSELIARSASGSVFSYPTVGDHPIKDACRLTIDPEKTLPFIIRREIISGVVDQFDVNNMYMNCLTFQEGLAFLERNVTEVVEVGAAVPEEMLEEGETEDLADRMVDEEDSEEDEEESDGDD